LEVGQNISIRRDSAGEDLMRSTKIELFLKENMREFLEEKKLKERTKRHSEFIGYPITFSSRKLRKKRFRTTKSRKRRRSKTRVKTKSRKSRKTSKKRQKEEDSHNNQA
jgi:molecular chaperone HtpG